MVYRLKLLHVESECMSLGMFSSGDDFGNQVGELTIYKEGFKWLGENIKGYIVFGDVDIVRIGQIDGEILEISIITRANNLYNANMKRAHPWRWRLGLITKSKGGVVKLGQIDDMGTAQTIYDFLQQFGCHVEFCLDHDRKER